MKKLLFFGLSMFSALTFAQDKPAAATETAPKKIYKSNKNPGKNEFKVNAFYLLLGAAEFSYERVLTEESSVGISVGGSFDKETFDYNYSVEPFYRYFFGRKPAAGFFIEGFGSINSKDYRYYNNNFDSFLSRNVVEQKTHFGLGIGLGGKFITKNNIVFEIGAGIGRNLTAPSDNYSYDGYNQKIMGRGGISVGYRF